MSVFAIKLRLDRINRDEVGVTGLFYGKPDIHGNAITVPLSEDVASRLKVGKQYVFVLAEDVGYEEGNRILAARSRCE